MCWRIHDLPFVEKIFKGAETLVVSNDCIQRIDVHREDETIFTSWIKKIIYLAKKVQYGQRVARVLQVAVQSSDKRCYNLVQVRREKSQKALNLNTLVEFTKACPKRPQMLIRKLLKHLSPRLL